jgi:hypothetical protein
MAAKKHKKVARLMKTEQYALTPGEELLQYWRDDPVAAAKDILGFDLIWLQRITLRAMWKKRFVLLCLSRGVGKSFMFALYAALRAMLYPDIKVGIVTPVYRQVKLYIFDEFKNWYHRSPLFRQSIYGNIVAGPDACRIKFTNGSLIEGLPIGHDGGKVRGQRYHDILVDEYAQQNTDLIKLVIRPMGNIRKHGRINKYHIASTPYFKWNHFWHQYLHYVRMAIKEPDKYEIVEFDYRDVNATRPTKLHPEVPYAVDEDMMQMQVADQPVEMFRMENLARFPDETTGFFPSKLIDFASPRLKDDWHPEAPCKIELSGQDNKDRYHYYIGVDVGRALHGSNFACAVCRYDKLRGRKRFVLMQTLNGGTHQEMVHTIRRLARKFNVVAITIGQGGGGLTMKDLLAVPYLDPETRSEFPPLIDPLDEQQMLIPGLPIVHIINETQGLNNYMYASLKADMEGGQMMLPPTNFMEEDMPPSMETVYKEIMKTKGEMLAIQADPTINGFKFTVPDGFQKDRITALVLCNYWMTEVAKEYQPEDEEIGEGFWISQSVGA